MAESPIPGKMSVVELKAKLKEAGQPITGTKPELLVRLVDHLVNPLNVSGPLNSHFYSAPRWIN